MRDINKADGSPNPNRGVVYLSLRETSTNQVAVKFAQAVGLIQDEDNITFYGADPHFFGQETSLQQVADVTKLALEQLRANKENRPIFVIDDVRKSIKMGVFRKRHRSLSHGHWRCMPEVCYYSRCFQVKVVSYPNCKKVSNTTMIPLLFTSHFLFAAVSGMSSRGRAAFINYADASSVRNYLKKHLGNILTEEEIQEVVDTVGGHLGDVERVLAEMKFGIPQSTPPREYLKGSPILSCLL
jgi:hypothetical protein